VLRNSVRNNAKVIHKGVFALLYTYNSHSLLWDGPKPSPALPAPLFVSDIAPAPTMPPNLLIQRQDAPRTVYAYLSGNTGMSNEITHMNSFR
jgi:hypothetical protein